METRSRCSSTKIVSFKERFYFLVSLLTLVILLITGCSLSSPNPVRYFMIIPGAETPPNFIVPDKGTMPFPTQTQIAMHSQRIYLVLVLDHNFEGDGHSLKYTFFNRDRAVDREIVFPPEAWTIASSLPQWCYAPQEPGNYELRVYHNNKVVAAAKLEVY